jgi:hypothetical protein
MTKEEIKNRISLLLGSQYNFMSYKTEQGVELKVEGESLVLETPIYVVTPEGELPAPEGEFVLDNGMTVKVEDGLVKEIVSGAETPVMEETVPEAMAEATLADGTKITNDQPEDVGFEVGQVVYVVTENGKELAPVGDHILESGEVVTLDENSVITGIKKPDEAGEGSLVENKKATMEDIVDEMMTALGMISKKMEEIKKEQEEMKSKFSKFSAEPASTKIYDAKNASPVKPLASTRAENIMKMRQLLS